MALFVVGGGGGGGAGDAVGFCCFFVCLFGERWQKLQSLSLNRERETEKPEKTSLTEPADSSVFISHYRSNTGIQEVQGRSAQAHRAGHLVEMGKVSKNTDKTKYKIVYL